MTPETLERAVEAAADGMYVVDRMGTIVFANRAILDITGYRREAFIGRSTSIFRSGRMTDEYYRRLWRTVLSGEVWHEVITNRRANGELYEASQTISPVPDERGEVRFFFAVQRDITVAGDHERELRQVQTEVERMLSQHETLLAEVHHRVKNDLLFTRSLLELQARDVAVPEAKEALLRAADRAGVLARVYQLLQGREVTSRVTLDRLVADLLEALVGVNLPGQTELSLDVEPIEVAPRVATAVSIVVNELAMNAAKHALAAVDRPRLDLRVRATPDGEIVLRFADNGGGFPDRVLAERQTGFGLGIVATVARQYDGGVELANDGGAVATVRMRSSR